MTQKDIKAIYKEIGQLIKEERKKQNMTMNHLAERAELSQSAISMIENGLRETPLKTLSKISAALGVDFTKQLHPYTPKDTADALSDVITIEAIGFTLTLGIQNFESEVDEQDINTAVQQALIQQVKNILQNEHTLESITEQVKETIKETVHHKQQQLNKIYRKIND